MPPEPTVFIAEDDPAFRRSLARLIESVGLPVETHSSGEELLDAVDADRSGCAVVDLRMPGLSGLDVHEQLVARGILLPVIIVSGYAEVTTAVRALKAGVVDFLEKPFNGQDLLDRIRAAVELDERSRAERALRKEYAERIASLTTRERQVLHEIVAGHPNKVIASDLGVSPRTVEVHRARIMEKMGVDSLAALVRATILLEGRAS